MAIQGVSFKLNSDGDIDFVENSQGYIAPQLISGSDELIQSIQIRLGTRLGEDVVHRRVGLPIAQMVNNPNRAFIEGLVRDQLEVMPRIASVEAISNRYSGDTRKLTLAIEATAIDGSAIALFTTLGGII